MSRLKVLSGSDVIRIFNSFGFEEVSRKGSHVKLRRASSSGEKQTLTIPDHNELDRGTLRAIYRQAQRYISMEALERHFFAE